MTTETSLDVFEVMHTMRAMRRLKPDPVPDEMLAKVLEAGVCAPSGQNLERWSFLAVTDPEAKAFFATRYDYWLKNRFADALATMDWASPMGRVSRAAVHLAEHMHEVPVLLLCMGQRDWPFSVPADERKGLAPPSYGTIYPCVQNILLACRALGLGASLTTMHQMFEPELHEYFGIPESWGVVSVIPIGFPAGKFGPVTRTPARYKTHFNRWGGVRPGLAEPKV